MRQKDYEKLASSIRSVLSKFGQDSVFQLKPNHAKALEKMAQDTEAIASSLQSINQKVPKLMPRITELLKKEDQRAVDLEKLMLEKQIRSESKLMLDGYKSQMKRAESESEKVRKMTRDQYNWAVTSVEAHIGFMTTGLILKKQGETLVKKERAAFLMFHVVSMIKLLQEIQSDKFLQKYHTHSAKQGAQDLIEGFKKSPTATSIPKRVEDIVIEALNLPSDLASALPKLLELRRTLDRLEIKTESDVKKITSYAEDVEQLASRLNKVDNNLQRFL